MIPSSGSQYLNMNCSLDESLQEVVRLRMLSQEDTFKNQVHELHRLYQIQTMLMKNSQMKGVGTEQLVNFTSQGMLQRPLRNTNQSLLNKRDSWGTRENPVLLDGDDSDTESSLDEVNLSLSIGGNTTKRKRGSEIFSSVSFQEIIDLEESIHTELGGKFGPGKLQVNKSHCFSDNIANKDLVMMMCSESLADESKTYAEQNSARDVEGPGEVPSFGDILPSMTKVLTSHEELILDLNKPPVDESVFDPKDLEVIECSSYGHTDRVTAGIRKDLTPDGGTSWKMSNKNCSNDESVFDPKDLDVMECSSYGRTDRVTADIRKDSTPDRGTSWKMSNKNCSNDESVFDPKDLEVMECSSYGRTDRVTADIWKDSTPDRGTGWKISNKSCSNEVSGITQHDTLETMMMAFDRMNSQQQNSDSGLTLLRSNESQTMVGVNDKVTSDQNAVVTNLCSGVGLVEDRDSSPASYKTGQSGIYTGKSDLSQANHSPNSESSVNNSPSLDESKCGSSDEKREEELRMNDPLLLKGAESLMSLILASSRGECNSCAAEVDDANEIVDGNNMDKPQYSSDTYESTVLKQKECSEEDYCVSSTHMDLIIPDNKDFGVKLRRGRRMKDFQKDILPTLASLSKQEISDDVRLMDGIIRSREYKRLRSQATKAQNINWFTPVRSRRSKLNYKGRKFS